MVAQGALSRAVFGVEASYMSPYNLRDLRTAISKVLKPREAAQRQRSPFLAVLLRGGVQLEPTFACIWRRLSALRRHFGRGLQSHLLPGLLEHAVETVVEKPKAFPIALLVSDLRMIGCALHVADGSLYATFLDRFKVNIFTAHTACLRWFLTKQVSQLLASWVATARSDFKDLRLPDLDLALLHRKRMTHFNSQTVLQAQTGGAFTRKTLCKFTE
eukprot:5834296-Amphidinium_carterae.1